MSIDNSSTNTSDNRVKKVGGYDVAYRMDWDSSRPPCMLLDMLITCASFYQSRFVQCCQLPDVRLRHYASCFPRVEKWSGVSLLALPITCAVLSIVVSILCLPRGATETIDGFETAAFTVDVGLTVIYLIANSLSVSGHLLTTTCLFASNLSAIVCFVPILRSTWNSPERELPTAWMIWTIAYGLLALDVILVHQLTNPLLLLYPVLNAILHGLVAAFAIRYDVDRYYLACTSRSLRIRRSNINGKWALRQSVVCCR